MNEKTHKTSHYGEVWDNYVTRTFPKITKSRPYAEKDLEPWRVLNQSDKSYKWPGDEWGDRRTSEALFRSSVADLLDFQPELLCEIGAGSGRYSVIALEEFTNARLLTVDVSSEFESALRKRCDQFIKSGRLDTILLDLDPLTLWRTIKKRELLGAVDVTFSLDAMVHVDMHTLFIYALTATRMLKRGGALAMNVADVENSIGFQKLLSNAPTAYASGGSAGAHFMWTSRAGIQAMLEKLGFTVEFPTGNGRDLSFFAKLVEPDAVLEWYQLAEVEPLFPDMR